MPLARGQPGPPQLVPSLAGEEQQEHAAANAKAARSSRMVTRLTRELSEAKAAARSLDIENVSLRAALERARDDIESAQSLRRELDETRARLREMEQRVLEESRRADDLRLEAREADAEKERLRTLLAGTVWYEVEKANR